MRPRSPETDVVFVVDECVGRRIVETIARVGGRAVMVTDYVDRGTEDVNWLPLARNWGSAVLTKDGNMRYIQAERDALKSCGCHVFILRGRELRFADYEEMISAHFRKMVNHVRKSALPFVASVTVRGGVEVKGGTSRRGGIKK